MYEMSLANVISQIVRSNFPHERNGSMKDGAYIGDALHVSFEVRMHDYSNTPYDERNANYDIQFLFWAHPHGNYIGVWSSVTPTNKRCTKAGHVAEWSFNGYHDSCWRDFMESVLNRAYFEAADKINKARHAAGHPTMAPKDFGLLVDFQLFAKDMFTWVPVEVRKDPNDPNNYNRLIKVLPKKD